MKNFIRFTLILLLFSCNKKEEFQTDQIADYLPLQSGKYITYQLDSTVFVNFGRTQEIHSYQEKQVVDDQIIDNLGRPSYRILRYLRDAAGTQSWQPAGSYLITPTRNSAEISESNLRFLKLMLPIKEMTQWNGNRYLPNEPYSSLYSFSNDDNMIDESRWGYKYEEINGSILLNNTTINNVITVKGADEAINVPIIDPSSFASINYVVDKYAKGIGLVYQELIMWEYQPNPNATAFTIGFGIKRSMIDHN